MALGTFIQEIQKKKLNITSLALIRSLLFSLLSAAFTGSNEGFQQHKHMLK